MRLSLSEFSKKEAEDIILCALASFLERSLVNDGLHIFVEEVYRDE